ncbi:Uncharacterized protein HZ326_24220 [Fusarium oxysporum f. sp. albedinis]|nr:Uncharacterized protein HZ326_24220 [Fusarium oxysporum f. sp. albedinis]
MTCPASKHTTHTFLLSCLHRVQAPPFPTKAIDGTLCSTGLSYIRYLHHSLLSTTSNQVVAATCPWKLEMKWNWLVNYSQTFFTLRDHSKGGQSQIVTAGVSHHHYFKKSLRGQPTPCRTASKLWADTIFPKFKMGKSFIFVVSTPQSFEQDESLTALTLAIRQAEILPSDDLEKIIDKIERQFSNPISRDCATCSTRSQPQEQRTSLSNISYHG